MMRTFEVKYELGHAYTETWFRTDYHCPHCGKREVWQRDGEGDYYVGPMILCVACMGSFSLPQQADAADWQDQQRAEHIRNDAR